MAIPPETLYRRQPGHSLPGREHHGGGLQRPPAVGEHPPQAKALIDFVKAVRYRNTLTPALTELAYTTASVANRCHY